MCGIAAVLLHPQERSDEEWQAIREIFTRNLLFNEERGKDASGLAVVKEDGTTEVLKMTIPAADFVHTEGYQSLLNSVDARTTLLLGHTRKPTQGSLENNKNNHPIQTGSVIGVHNGHIKNDDELFERCGFPREGEVDSEIIFRMLEPLDPRKLNGDYLSAARERLHLLRGQYTFIASDQRAPTKLMVLKHLNPLCIHYEKSWNALVFSSRYIFLRKAFGRSVITETLPNDELLIFDAQTIEKHASNPAAQCSLLDAGLTHEVEA